MAIENLITAAQAEVTQAEQLPTTDPTRAEKIAAAKAKVAGLEAAKNAGYTMTQADVTSAVQGRLPDAQSSARTEERRALAQKLGVKIEDLDAEVTRLAGEKRSGETQADQERRAKEAAETARTTAEGERDKWKRTAESARENLRASIIRSAVEGELRNQGVIVNDTTNYLGGAYELTDKSAVNVQIDVKDDGTLEVKGGVTGAKEAAEKTKQQYAAMFGEPPPENPRQGPERRQGGGEDGSTSHAQRWGANLGPRGARKEGAAT